MGRLGEYREMNPLPYLSGKGLSGCFAVAYGEKGFRSSPVPADII